jgi:hypothetical protein
VRRHKLGIPSNLGGRFASIFEGGDFDFPSAGKSKKTGEPKLPKVKRQRRCFT